MFVGQWFTSSLFSSLVTRRWSAFDGEASR
jgi:hypothetical protein